jgi:hypothetical protein
MRALLISFITAAPDVLVSPGFWCGMWLWCYVAGVRMSTSRVGHLCVLRYRLINAVFIAIELLLNSLLFPNVNIVLELKGSKQRHSWLAHCTTSRRRAGSIPDYVIVIFY